MGRTRYTVNDVTKSNFYQLPKFLFEGEFIKLSNDARVLYSLLKDRHNLSLINGWINENNEVYLIYTRKDMQTMLGRSDKTVKNAVEQLKQFGLLEEEQQGLNRPNKIYLTSLSLDTQGHGNSPCPGVGDSPCPESENLRSNNTNINNTDNSNNNLSIKEDYLKTESSVLKSKEEIDRIEISQKKKLPIPDDRTTAAQKEIKKIKDIITQQIDYNNVKNLSSLVDNIFDLMIDVACCQKSTIKIAGEDKPTGEVQKVFSLINQEHIKYIVECLEKNESDVKNIKAYLLTTIYNAPRTMAAYYSNKKGKKETFRNNQKRRIAPVGNRDLNKILGLSEYDKPHELTLRDKRNLNTIR